MSFEPRDYLKHIVAEADYLLGRSAGLTFEAFVVDETLRRAFVRSLEVIGQATKKVPEDFRALHPSVEWRAMAGMRDRLIHDYFGVDYELVWDVVRHRFRSCETKLLRYSRPNHRRAALQEVRFAIEDATRGQTFEHRLRDFNNLPTTTFADVIAVLRVAADRVRSRLKAR